MNFHSSFCEAFPCFHLIIIACLLSYAFDNCFVFIELLDETSEVINPSVSEESGLKSTVKEHVEDDLEVQSPKTSRRGDVDASSFWHLWWDVL